MNFLNKLLEQIFRPNPDSHGREQPQGPLEAWALDSQGRAVTFLEKREGSRPRLWTWVEPNEEYWECRPSEGTPSEFVQVCLTGYPWEGTAPPDDTMPLTVIIPYSEGRQLRLVIRSSSFDVDCEWVVPWRPFSRPLLNPDRVTVLANLPEADWPFQTVSPEQVQLCGSPGLYAFDRLTGLLAWSIPHNPLGGKVSPLLQGQLAWCDDRSAANLSYLWSRETGWLPICWSETRPSMWSFDGIVPGVALKISADVSYDCHVEESCYVDYYFCLEQGAWKKVSAEPPGHWTELKEELQGPVHRLENREGIGVCTKNKLQRYPRLPKDYRCLDWCLVPEEQAVALLEKEGKFYLASWSDCGLVPLVCCKKKIPTENSQCPVCGQIFRP